MKHRKISAMRRICMLAVCIMGPVPVALQAACDDEPAPNVNWSGCDKQGVDLSGLDPQYDSVRGGTDGSRLTEMGLPTPNLCGGGMNIHSKKEWIAVSVMEKCVQLLIELACSWADEKK